VFAGITDTPEAGWGAAMPQGALDELGSAGDTFRSGVVALADGVDADAFAERIVALTGEAPGSVEEPVELARLREIEAFPWVLTAFLVLVGLMAIAHAILVTTRRRRGDLAVLRSMGLARRGVYAAISVQALALAALGVVVGVPLGVAAGQALWRSVASSLGVVVIVDVPWLAIAASVVAACACVTLLALLPARAAARARPAYALRAE
jgi:predicted lysophospholipase L1 biosynthesis ABC-type transport system permease subunit